MSLNHIFCSQRYHDGCVELSWQGMKLNVDTAQAVGGRKGPNTWRVIIYRMVQMDLTKTILTA